MTDEPYFQPPGSEPRCSTERSARVRQHRFDMGYEERTEPSEYACLAEEAKNIFLQNEGNDPALARATALRLVVECCPVEIEADDLLLGGEDPFFFNLMLPALQADRYARSGLYAPEPETEELRQAGIYYAAILMSARQIAGI